MSQSGLAWPEAKARETAREVGKNLESAPVPEHPCSTKLLYEPFWKLKCQELGGPSVA